MQTQLFKTTTPALALIMSLIVRIVLATILTQAGGEARAQNRVQVGTKDSAGTHGSFGMILAGGAGHLSPVNEDGDVIYVFAEPPRVVKVYQDGPADGKLRSGDLITGIDGMDITHEDAGWMLQHPLEGRAYEVTVSRDDRERTYTLTAGEPDHRRVGENTIEVVEENDDGTIHVTSYTMNEDGAVTRMSESITGTGGAKAKAWFGLGLEGNILYVKRADDGQTYAFFDESPKVYNVDPDSPADQAGIRRGDRLVKIDGMRLDEAGGGQVWSLTEPGEEVELLLVREGEVYSVQLVGEDHPNWTVRRDGQRVSVIRESSASDEHLRYAGVVGNVDIEVRGVSDVNVIKKTGEVIIKTGDSTIRVTVRDE